MKAHHLQMIDLAREAVYEQEIGERHFTGTTVPIKREHYAKAVEIALEAQRKLLDLAAPSDADDVYQLNTQLFKLTKSRRLH